MPCLELHSSPKIFYEVREVFKRIIRTVKVEVPACRCDIGHKMPDLRLALVGDLDLRLLIGKCAHTRGESTRRVPLPEPMFTG